MEYIPFEKVSLPEAKAALDADLTPKAKVNWEQFRRPQNPKSMILTDHAVKWLFSVPREILPKTLAREYPRIINYIADRWETPSACVAYLDELLIDERGTRQGFSQKIVFELNRLKLHLAPLE